MGVGVCVVLRWSGKYFHALVGDSACRMPRAVQLEPSRDIVGLTHSGRADSGSRRYIPTADPSIKCFATPT